MSLNNNSCNNNQQNLFFLDCECMARYLTLCSLSYLCQKAKTNLGKNIQQRKLQTNYPSLHSL